MKKQEIRVALSMIIEEKEPIEIVRRSIESIERYVDGLFVTVTYKKKQPKNSKLLRFLKSKNVNISFWKWTYRFDEARNFAISQIPQEYFYYLWQDVDDVWQGSESLPQIIREAYIHNHSAVFFDYWYRVDLDEHGKIREVVVRHKRERLVKNDGGWKWIGRLHETLIEQRKYNTTKVYRKEAAVVHLTDDKRVGEALDRNIHILEEALKEEKRKDPRTLMYLAKAYFDRGKGQEEDENKKKVDLDLAEMLFKEYLEGSGKPGINYQGGSGWSEERSSAWEYIGEIYRHRRLVNMAIKATVNSLIEEPKFPNYYLDMSMNYANLQEWDKAEIWLEIAKRMPNPKTTLIETPRDLKVRALELDFHIAKAKNDLDRAKKAAELMVEVLPNNKDMRDRVKQIDNLRIMNKAAQSVAYLARYLDATKQKGKLAELTKSIPKEIEGERFAAEMRHKFLPLRVWDKDEIAIVCGPGFEQWSPKSLDKGLGGSETAVIHMGRELAKLGYKVTVYGDPREESGEHDKVMYKPWYEVNVKDSFNVLVLWRAVGFVDQDFSAKQTYLWMHDVPNVAEFTERRVARIDKIFVLSEYHKSLLRMQNDKRDIVKLPEEKVFVSANGIIPPKLDPKIKRDPFRMIYASSYDRGLVHLLALWPEIKKQVPNAHLHIFYGWNLFDKIVGDNPERRKWKGQMVKMMQQKGITEHGRIGQKDLKREFMKSGIFAYPTDFQEISCINAMHAQSHGAVPVVTNYAALKETVKWGKKVNCDITSKDGKKEYLAEVTKAMKHQKWQDEEREKMIEGAKKIFLWKDAAKQWDDLFKSHSNTVKLI